MVLSPSCCLCSNTATDNHGSISSLSIDDIANLQPSEKAGIELGSKLNLVSWIFYVCSIWSAKTCLLSYYNSFS